ncbi:MAG: hypothetical protein ABFC62_05865 [Clostridiaceae bacterium]|nr:hypothetical protein [Eubacteriales bacterium]
MEKSGFFNSSGGDRVYDASDFAGYFAKLVTNGIFYADTTNLKVTASDGMHVLVAPGSAWIRGYAYENTLPLELTLTTANGTNPRIDRVVLRLSAVDRKIALSIKTGAALDSPVPTALTRTAEVYELGLADVLVGKGVVAIMQDKITDTRLDSALCGTVNSLITAVYE